MKLNDLASYDLSFTEKRLLITIYRLQNGAGANLRSIISDDKKYSLKYNIIHKKLLNLGIIAKDTKRGEDFYIVTNKGKAALVRASLVSETGETIEENITKILK